ncbi:hypothetical protein D3C78_1308100 [compost metagenome]
MRVPNVPVVLRLPVSLLICDAKKLLAKLLGPDNATSVAAVGPNKAWSPERFASPSCALNNALPPSAPVIGVANPVIVVETGADVACTSIAPARKDILRKGKDVF